MENLQQLFDVVIVPILGILTAYLVKFIDKQIKDIECKTSDEMAAKYINILGEIVKEAVVSTNQTYVNVLKGKNAFTKEAQEEAFKQTQEKVYSILTCEMKTALESVYGDLDLYISNKIEAEVNSYKAAYNATK